MVEDVLVLNPGPLSKAKGPGTLVEMSVQPRSLTGEEREESGEEGVLGHRIFERARVDVLGI